MPVPDSLQHHITKHQTLTQTVAVHTWQKKPHKHSQSEGPSGGDAEEATALTCGPDPASAGRLRATPQLCTGLVRHSPIIARPLLRGYAGFAETPSEATLATAVSAIVASSVLAHSARVTWPAVRQDSTTRAGNAPFATPAQTHTALFEGLEYCAICGCTQCSML